MAIGNGIITQPPPSTLLTVPIYKGALERAINATDGKELWTLDLVHI